jgi:hypothetical protein
MSRTGLIHGTCVNYANPIHYEYEIYQQCDIMLRHFEIKKEYVYKQGYCSKCLVIYAVDSRKDEIDEELKSFKLGDGTHRRYMSFRGTAADDRLRTLYLNELNNVEVRFETLNSVNTNDLAMYNEE